MTKEDGTAAPKTCRSCGYYCPMDQVEGEEGTCRRHTPTVMPYLQNYEVPRNEIGALSAPKSPYVTVFPVVGADDWCGEWGEYSLSRPVAP